MKTSARVGVGSPTSDRPQTPAERAPRNTDVPRTQYNQWTRGWFIEVEPGLWAETDLDGQIVGYHRSTTKKGR